MLVSASASVLAGTGNGDLTDGNINYVGRWDKSSSTTFRSYWVGAYMTTKFSGTTVKVKLGAPTRFTAIVDGVATPYWDASGTVNLTSTPLASGTHTLKIVAKYQTQNSEIPFQGLVLDSGATTLKADNLPVVEFIGDSITAGETTSDYATASYAWQTGERLGADHTQIAYPGITLSQGYHYDWNKFPGMETLFFKLQQADRCVDETCAANPLWDFSKYAAKLVVVNIGTNDGNNSVPSATFQSRYTTFLQNVRAKYPNADIFAMRPFNGAYQTETQAAVTSQINSGDGKLHYVDTTGWLGDSQSDFTDGLHPSDTGHIKVTNRLLPILLPYIGVVTKNDNQFSYDNTANWPSGWQTGAWQNDNHWSSVANASYQVSFNGTQVKWFGGKASSHGIAAVSVDNGTETLVDTYAATRADGVPLWTSPVLSAGNHTLKVRATGQKNANASNTFVTGDRVDVVNGGVNLVSNAGFEAGGNGWNVVSSGSGQSVVSTTRPNSGTSHLTHASTVPYWVATYQILSGLPNGQYTLRAWVRGTAGHQLYVKNYNSTGESMAVTTSATDAYTQLVIPNINVSNGNAEIGFWTSDGSGTGWLNVDDMTFYKQ
jgi:lysophospholipase L1-like esterase